MLSSPELKGRTLGYGIDLDKFDAITQLDNAGLAKKAGFEAIWVFDHFHPWFHTNAKESHAWIWMTTALERVSGIPFGTAVTAPIFRYHPALVAQAFATMPAIYGPRVILGVGTGEAMNEVPLGFSWPSISERRARLVEAVSVMRELCTGEFVDFSGKHYTLKTANLYMKANFPIYIAAFGPKMAEVAGKLGDGFITSNQSPQYFKDTLVPAIRAGARSAGKDFEAITKATGIDVSYDEDYEKALAPARMAAASSATPGSDNKAFTSPIADPREIEKLGAKVTDNQLTETLRICAMSNSPDDHIKRIENAFDAGFDHVYVSSASPSDRKCIDMYRKKVLPYFAAQKER